MQTKNENVLASLFHQIFSHEVFIAHYHSKPCGFTYCGSGEIHFCLSKISQPQLTLNVIFETSPLTIDLRRVPLRYVTHRQLKMAKIDLFIIIKNQTGVVAQR